MLPPPSGISSSPVTSHILPEKRPFTALELDDVATGLIGGSGAAR